MNALCYETINRSPFVTPGFEADLPAQLAAAAEAGFEAVGLDLATLDQADAAGFGLAAVASRLGDLGLRCFELQPLIVTPDAKATAKQAEGFAEAARILGAPWVQCGMGGPVDAALAESFRRAASVVAGGGARLALEYLPFAPIRSIADSRAFLAEAKAPGAAIVVDSWHFFHGPESWDALEGLALEELAYPQFNDHGKLASDDLMMETMQQRCLPGQGEFELERFAKCLRDKGYSGPVSVEILNAEMRTWEPARFAREVCESARPYWS